MKVAMPIWEGRISPVLDSARRLLLIEVEGNEEVDRYEVLFEGASLVSRADHVCGLGVDVLICGGVSRSLGGLLEDMGVTVVPWISGKPDRVLSAYLSHDFSQARFAMPGHSPPDATL